MKKNERTFYKPIGGSAPLSIYFYEAGALGDAVEANNEIGVGWFSPNGELLAVQFDDVDEKKDRQVLEFDRYRIEVSVNKGKVSYSCSPLDSPKRAATA